MTEVSLRSAITISPDVVFRQLDDEAVLLNLESGVYFGLNDVGARIWQLIERGQDQGGATLSDIAAALAGEFAASPAEIEGDLLELIRQLLGAGLVAAGGTG